MPQSVGLRESDTTGDWTTARWYMHQMIASSEKTVGFFILKFSLLHTHEMPTMKTKTSVDSFEVTLPFCVTNHLCGKWKTFAVKGFVVVSSLSRVQFFVTPWTVAYHAPLSSANSWSLLKFMSFGSVMLSNHLTLCRPLLLLEWTFPASGSFPMSQLFASGGQSIGASASASVLPMNIQDWFPLGWTGWISLQFKGLSRVFSSTTIQKHQFFSTQPSLWTNCHIVHDYWKNQFWLYRPLSAKWCLFLNTLSRFVIACLPRSKHLLEIN